MSIGTDYAYWNCRTEYPLGRGPLSSAEYCAAVRDNPALSVGPPPRSIADTGGQIPSIYLGTPKIDRRDEIPPKISEVAGVSVADQPGFAGWHNPSLGQYVFRDEAGNLSIQTAPGEATGATFNSNGDNDVGVIRDTVGQIGAAIPGTDIFDIGGAIYDVFGNPQPVMNAQGPVVVNQGAPAQPQIAGPVGMPAAQCTTSCGPSPVYKKVCGQYKWVMPKRKRRRQLLTNKDYNDLLKLQTLKVNQNMTAAISKALTR